MDDQDLNENNEKNSQKADKQIEDTVKGVKDGASLAKNVATGNALGAAKDAINLAKNKKARNAIIRTTVMNMLVPILIILIVASVVLGFLGTLSEVGEAVQEVISSIIDFFTVDKDNGAIKVTDEQIDTIINTITELGVNPEDLKLLGDYDDNATDSEKQEAMRKYIRRFYEAQAVTQTLNYNKGGGAFDNNTYGVVYVYRLDDETTTDLSDKEKEDNQLTYIPYDEMLEYANETDNKSAEKARKYFSIDDAGNLVYVATTRVIVEKGDSVDNLSEESDTSVISLRSINYKSAISQYTTKMNFLLYLTMVSQNPEFVSAVVDLIKDSRIEITLMDNVSETVSVETYTYGEHTRSKYTYEDSAGNEYTGHRIEFANKTEVTRTTTKIHTPTAKVTYAKTWFSEQKIIYNKVVKEPIVLNYTYDASTDSSLQDQQELTGDQTGSWRVNQVKTYNDVTNSSVFEEGVRGDVDFSRLGQKGDSERYANGQIDEPTFIGLMETRFDIPYSTRVEEAGSNLVSGAEILFSLLQNEAELETMEEIMRYALYLYSGKDYGVTELDGSFFEISDFISVSGLYGSSVQENVWYALKSAGFSDIATAAVMGNIQVESGFDSAIIEHGSGAGFGLCQWTGGRRTALENYASSIGVEPSNLKVQLDFLLAELTPGGGANGYASYQLGGTSSNRYDGNGYRYSDWKDSSSVSQATVAFMALFERPSYKSSVNHMSDRISYAESFYAEYSGRTVPEGYDKIGIINLSSENYGKMLNMLSEAIRICDDNRYTYSQDNRYGEYQFDCSSFVYRLYQQYFGISIPTTTSGYSTSSPNCIGAINSVELQPGDVLWRNGHVEIYLGNGLTAGAKSGKVAIADQVKISNLNYNNFTHVFRFITE